MPSEPLAALLARLGEVISGSYEVLLIDDGNPHQVRAWLRILAAAHRSVRLVSLRKNGGQQRATLTGAKLATGRIIVTMDDDCGHPPELVPQLVTQLEEADLVYGVPDKMGSSWLRRAGTLMNRSIFRLFLGVPRDLPVTSFRAFRASLLPSRVGSAEGSPPGSTRRLAIPPNLSAMLLARRPRVGAIRYSPPVPARSRLSIRSLVSGILWLAGWWAPAGALRRVFGRNFEIESYQ